MLPALGSRHLLPGARCERDRAHIHTRFRSQGRQKQLAILLLIFAALTAAATLWASSCLFSRVFQQGPKPSNGPEVSKLMLYEHWTNRQARPEVTELHQGIISKRRTKAAPVVLSADPAAIGNAALANAAAPTGTAAAAGSSAAATSSDTTTTFFSALLLNTGHYASNGISKLLPAGRWPQPPSTDQLVELEPDPLAQLDSCRRCAAFSASDFLPDAPDADSAVDDPDWQVTASPPLLLLLKAKPQAQLGALLQGDVHGQGQAGTRPQLRHGGGGGDARGAGSSSSRLPDGDVWALGADLRRHKCREVGSFLGSIVANEMEAYRRRVVRYVRSPEYRARAASISASGGRGILISAGGSNYTINLIITLHVLRRHWGCRLPVEVAWQGPTEMDNATWASLERHFAPIRGFDVRAAVHPVPELHGNSFDATSYGGKVYALVHSRFREVLMMDADSLPLRNPSTLFDDPRFVKYGSLFWPDAWTGQARSAVYGTYGVNYAKAQHVLFMGMGFGRRDAESGQVLLDRARHLDVLEALLMANRRRDANRYLVWGDKDTFAVAFAAVGKAHCYNQVSVPPSAYLTWAPDKLLTKATDKRGPGWVLGGFVQHLEDAPYVYGMDNTTGGASRTAAAPAASSLLSGLVSPAFLHRTIRKYNLDVDPGMVQLLTAPMTQSWASYFLAHDNPGPTRGVPWDYAVPETALRIMTASASEGLDWGNSGDGGLKSTGAPAGAANGGTAAVSGTANRHAQGVWTWWRERYGRNGHGRGGGGRGGGDLSAEGGNGKDERRLISDSWQGLGTSVVSEGQKVVAAAAAAAEGGDGFGDEDDVGGGGGHGNGTCPLRLWRRRQQRRRSGPGTHPPSRLPPPPPAPRNAGAGADDDREGDLNTCPLDELYDYLKALDSGLPMDRQPLLKATCTAEIRTYAADAIAERDRAAAAALAVADTADAASTANATNAVDKGNAVSAAKDRFPASRTNNVLLSAFREVEAAGLLGQVPLPRSSAGDFYPYIEAKGGSLSKAPPSLPAVQYDWQDPWPCEDAPFVSAVQASYRAYIWLHRHQRQFPIVGKS